MGIVFLIFMIFSDCTVDVKLVVLSKKTLPACLFHENLITLKRFKLLAIKDLCLKIDITYLSLHSPFCSDV